MEFICVWIRKRILEICALAIQGAMLLLNRLMIPELSIGPVLFRQVRLRKFSQFPAIPRPQFIDLGIIFGIPFRHRTTDRTIRGEMVKLQWRAIDQYFTL